jgi:thiamine biosynthesis lipoprotein
VNITVYDPQQGVDILLDAAVREINRIEMMASDYIDTSEVGRVNRGAGTGAVSVSPELSALVSRAVDFGLEHESAFNISLGPLVHRWDFLSATPTVLSRVAVDSLLPLTALGRIRVEPGRVSLALPGMRLDLGGIAKGYAVERALAVLRKGGSRRAIVDIGGNLGVMWEGTSGLDSTAATIWIRHPRIDDAFFGQFPVGTGGVSTSGDYQRCFIIDGRRYHHILDPSTGYPASGVVSVTIVAPDAETADVWSTLVFVLGRTRGMELIRSTPGIDGLIVYEEGDSLAYEVSPGLARLFIRGDAVD